MKNSLKRIILLAAVLCLALPLAGQARKAEEITPVTSLKDLRALAPEGIFLRRGPRPL